MAGALSLSNQSIQFYQDEVCIDRIGSAIDLASNSIETSAFNGVGGRKFSYRIKSYYSDQDPTDSACSAPMSIKDVFAVPREMPIQYAISGSDFTGRMTSVADGIGRRYVVGIDGNGPVNSATVFTYTNGAWRRLGGTFMSTGYASWPNIAIDQNSQYLCRYFNSKF